MATPATLSQVPAQTPYIQYVATNGQTVFPYPFEITQDSDLVVVANGSTLATDSGYTLSGVGNSTGGNLTFTSGRTAGDIITLYRDIPIERLTQFAQNGGFSSTAFNAEFNNVYLLLQQLQQSLDQCLQIPNTNNPAPTTTLTGANYAGKYLSFDSNGNPQPAALTSSGPVTRTLVEGLLGSAVRDSVLLHNADNTGAADSTAAFNAAAAANTDYVDVPPGTYKLSSNTNAGMWYVHAGVIFTGPGALMGQAIQHYGANGAYTFRVVTNAQTASQLIPLSIEAGFYQSATPNAADQFGQTTEAWTPSSSAVVWNGELTGTYGSFSHFGSGNITAIYGGGFEGFNAGSGTATIVVGVQGNANNGGVAAGDPQQTPSNNGAATNLRAVTGTASNLASGTVANAAVFFANAVANTGGGVITNAYGLSISDQTAGQTNYAIFTGAGLNAFGDVVRVGGSSNLPAATNTGKLYLAGGFTSPSAGRIYCGDGTGLRLEFAKRTGGADTVVGYVNDAGSFVCNGVTSTGAALGYGAGAGNTIAQATSKGTAVTLNTTTGAITTNNAALASGATITFNFNNSKLNANSILVLSIQSGATSGAYVVTADNMQIGVCNICIHNQSGGSLSEAIVINFAIIQGSAS